MLLQNDENYLMSEKEGKVSLVESLLGQSRDAKHILTSYK